MRRFLVFLLLSFLVFGVGIPVGLGKILSPDEALPLLQRVVEKMTQRNYWGLWEMNDYAQKDRRFYEVLFLKEIGFGWKELGAEDLFHVKVGSYRYVFDLTSGEKESVYPFYDLPFFPFEEDDLELILKNYLIYFQDAQLSFFSRYSGEIVRSFTLDEDGFLLSKISYAQGGKVRETGRFVYLDFSPDYHRLASYLQLMEECTVNRVEGLSVAARRRIFFPRLLPPGFQLKRSYMVKSGKKQFYHLLYSDGLRYFTISQSVFPRSFSRSIDFRPVFWEEKTTNHLVLIGEKEGFSLSLTGDFDVEVGSQILESLEREGGR